MDVGLDGLPEDLVSEASAARLQRWLDAGSPEPDLGRLAYLGDATVHAILTCTLEALPVSVRWHAVEWVTWREVGRDAGGWRANALPRRDPPGDIAHEITIDGHVSDEELPGLIGHELAHSCHAPILLSPHAAAERPWMSDVEATARQLLLGRGMGLDEEAVAQMRADEETIADRTAAAWGLRRAVRPTVELERARARVAEAAELVPDIELRCRP